MLDPSMQVIPKPCSRCGAGTIDEDYQEEQKIEAVLCGEVQMAFGLIAWLCHQCRRDWHRQMKEHPLQREYSILQLKLEFWRNRIGPDTPDEKLDEGLKLVNAIEDMELKINNFANEWLMG